MFNLHASALITALLLTILSTAAYAANSSTQCPQGMMSVEGKFCVDIYEYPNVKGSKPLSNVTWDQAVKLCKAKGKRLCSHAEWKTACGGPNNLMYSYGNEHREGVCNDSPAHKGAVLKESGQMESCVSDYGVYDMSGNVWEWVSDNFDKYGVGRRGIQGGSFADGSEGLSCSERIMESRDASDMRTGLRCCMSISETPDTQAIVPKQLPSKTSIEAPAAALSAPLVRYKTTSIQSEFYLGVEYADLGDIFTAEESQSYISSAGLGITVGYGFDGVVFNYTRMEYKIKSLFEGVPETQRLRGNVFQAAYILTSARNFDSWEGNLSFGIRRFDSKPGQITELYIAKEFSSGDWTLIPALNYLDRTLEGNRIGGSIDIRYHVSPALDIFGVYNSNDFYKSIANYYIVPLTSGFDKLICAGCLESSSSAGISYSLPKGRSSAYLLIYDIGDLNVPMGGTIFKF